MYATSSGRSGEGAPPAFSGGQHAESLLRLDFLLFCAAAKVFNFCFWLLYDPAVMTGGSGGGNSVDGRGVQMVAEGVNLLLLSDFLYHRLRIFTRGADSWRYFARRNLFEEDGVAEVDEPVDARANGGCRAHLGEQEDEEEETSMGKHGAAEEIVRRVVGGGGTILMRAGRRPGNDLVVEDARISGLHFMLKVFHRDEGLFVQLVDSSTNGVWVNGRKSDADDALTNPVLRSGDVLTMLAGPRVQPQERLSFELLIDPEAEEGGQQKITKLRDELAQDISCGICADVLYKPICLVPCLHNFCTSCYVEWVHTSVVSARTLKPPKEVCPICRAAVSHRQLNCPLVGIVDTFLKNHPEKRRQDLPELDRKEKKYMSTKDFLQKYEPNAPNRRRPSASSRESAACVVM
eukprot:g9208.t1